MSDVDMLHMFSIPAVNPVHSAICLADTFANKNGLRKQKDETTMEGTWFHMFFVFENNGTWRKESDHSHGCEQSNQSVQCIMINV